MMVAVGQPRAAEQASGATGGGRGGSAGARSVGAAAAETVAHARCKARATEAAGRRRWLGH